MGKLVPVYKEASWAWLALLHRKTHPSDSLALKSPPLQPLKPSQLPQLQISSSHILIESVTPQANRMTILESNALIKFMLHKNLCARHRLLVKETTVPETKPYSTHSVQLKWDGKTFSPLSACLTSFKNQLKLNRKMSKHRHLFLTKSRSFKSSNINQEEQKTKMPIKKHSFNISEAANWRRIDALVDDLRKEGTHM